MRRILLLALVFSACGGLPSGSGGGDGGAGGTACVTSVSCPTYHCECRNGTAVDSSRCSPTSRTCEDRIATCTQACVERGGWP